MSTADLLKENHDLRGLVAELKEHCLAQCAQLEQHNANLTNLYVASYQLHATLDRQAVLGAVQEIIVNLVGSEEFAILECDPCGEFLPVASMGVEDATGLHHREARIAQSATSGDLWIRPSGEDSILTACIPLKLDGRVTGCIAIYRLLAHKSALEPLDHELFDLLATHAATALYCTSLAETIRGAERSPPA